MAKRKKAPTRIVYSHALAAAMCDLIAGGLSLKQACDTSGMPGRTTAYKWLGLHDEFALMYARAREERAELVADEVITIADDPGLDPHDKRVRIDARKWWVSKVNPKKYGDTITSAVNVTADHKHHHTAEPLSESAHWIAKLLGVGTDSEAAQPVPNGSLLSAPVRVRSEGH